MAGRKRRVVAGTVWVFVATCNGTEHLTEVFTKEEDAKKRYRAYARENNIPWRLKTKKYDWSGTKFNAWITPVVVPP